MINLILRRIFPLLALMAIILAMPFPAMANPKASSPTFEYRITPIPPDIEAQMKHYIWQPDCPVAITDLAYVKLTYWGMDHKRHLGYLIVNKQLAPEVVDIFRQIYKARFPIDRMVPIPFNEAMATNATSSYYCRINRSNPNQYSLHSYGYAIDINTLINPYVMGNRVEPPPGRAYLDRSKHTPGMIVRDDKVYKIFIKHGWTWGGDFIDLKDYMHFEKDLRPNKPEQNNTKGSSPVGATKK